MIPFSIIGQVFTPNMVHLLQHATPILHLYPKLTYKIFLILSIYCNLTNPFSKISFCEIFRENKYSIFCVFALNFTFIIRYFSFERTTKLFFMQPLSDGKILFLALKVETVLRGYYVKKQIQATNTQFWIVCAYVEVRK